MTRLARRTLVTAIVAVGLLNLGALAQTHPPAPSTGFARLLEQYRQGDADVAVEAFSKWSEAEINAATSSIAGDDYWAKAAVAALHTEAGLRRGTFGMWAGVTPRIVAVTDWGLTDVFEGHSFLSYQLIKGLTVAARNHHDDTLLAFCKSWYITTISYCLRNRVTHARDGLIAMADHDFGEDAEIRLLIGSMAEAMAGPFVPTATFSCGGSNYFVGPDGCIFDPPAPSGHAGPIQSVGERATVALVDPKHPSSPKQEALWAFRSAVKLDPALVEAHLRLGRFLHLVGQNVEAREQLEQAFAEGKDEQQRFVAYMAALFLGELDEHDAHYTAAIARYREAVAAAPGAHTANAALGGALLRSGVKSGWGSARQMFDGESRTNPAQPDPWSFYRYAQYWQAADRLRRMREAVREGSLR